MFRLLKNLETIRGASIQPVFVSTPSFIEISQRELMSRIQKLIRASGLKTVKRPIILKEKSKFQRAVVKRLLDYCEEKEVSMIAVATHARKGLPRWMLGSFAETLLLLSPISLMFVNPRQPSPQTIRKIFFPTDLGTDSRKALVWTMDLAEEFKASLHIHSVLQVFQRGVLLSQDVGGIPFPIWITTNEAKEKGKVFLNTVRSAGIEGDFTYENSAGSVVDLLLKKASQVRADLVSMAAEPRPRLPLMVGSMTRQIVRRARCPVYIYRPEI